MGVLAVIDQFLVLFFHVSACQGGLRCDLFHTVDSLSLTDFDAVVFDIIYYRTDFAAQSVIPKDRDSKQRYVLFTNKSPSVGISPPLINDYYFGR